jgi:hypothetical protein
LGHDDEYPLFSCFGATGRVSSLNHIQLENFMQTAQNAVVEPARLGYPKRNRPALSKERAGRVGN